MAQEDLTGKYTTVEGTFEVPGKKLYTKSWLPTGPVKAKMVHIHGYSDHINRYYELFPSLASRGIAVYGFDQRGWGRSVAKPSEKGQTGPTTRVLADMVAFIKPHVLPGGEGPHPPVFVLGHSMGGGQVLTLMCDRTYAADSAVCGVAGWLLECPYIQLMPAQEPSQFTLWAGKVASKVLPNVQLKKGIPADDLSRDPAVVQSLKDDPLCFNVGTLLGLADMMDRAEALSGHTVTLDPGVIKKVWIAHGTGDKALSWEATKKWYDDMTGAVPDRTWKPYDGYYHQLHSDYGKEVFYKDVGDWILSRAESESAGAPQPVAEEQKKAEAKL